MCKVVMIDRLMGTEEEIFEGTKFQCETVSDRMSWNIMIKGIKFEVRD